MQIHVDSIREAVKSQFDIAWRLLEYHLNGIDDDECLWRPCPKGVFVEKISNGWVADWPKAEGYELGPPNIAWLTWHIIFWWSMVFDHSFDRGALRREDVIWPGTIAKAEKTIFQFRQNWLDRLSSLSDEDFTSTKMTKWPFEDKPFYELAAWLNVELMKNTAEIGYCRFLYANRSK